MVLVNEYFPIEFEKQTGAKFKEKYYNLVINQLNKRQLKIPIKNLYDKQSEHILKIIS